ncbi:MAG: SDR family NAD(P)-dependent oxidoreductase [Gammaproteobacteria bacterium]|jgi:NAD(P)-dependent dehydrogenase (short-subunit alcohol dehydrogenase family)|nr:SDR family NAD(P)-dependent oxidoreductase [Gammaproteobacteria bacterium]
MPTTVLITGATDGIGRALALALAARGMRVLLHGRNEAKLAAARQAVLDASPAAEVHPLCADFASLEDVAGLARQVARDYPTLNVLVNNAGLLTDHRQLSADGFELTRAVNYLAPYLLTRQLLPVLLQQAPARIVNVASTAMGGGQLDFGNLELQTGFSGWQAYANSKLANVLFSSALARTLDPATVTCNALCPGLVDTNFFHTNTVFANGGYERLRPGMRTPEEGALVPLYLAGDPAAAQFHGEFFVRDGTYGRRPVPLGLDPGLADRLWHHTAAQLAPWLGAAG